jgi:hypothetical protein
MASKRARCIVLMVLAGFLIVSGPVWGAPGDQLWETPFTFLSTYDTISVTSTALSATTFIISGNARNASGTGGQIGFIKAFDIASGAVKWEKTLTVGATGNSFGLIAINGDIAIIRGSSISASETPPTLSLSKAFIRFYQADTGQQLGEVVRDFESTPLPTPLGPTPLLTANNRAFTFFAAQDSSGVAISSTLYVRAYEVRTTATAPMLLLDNEKYKQ